MTAAAAAPAPPTFWCAHYRCKLTEKACVGRQESESKNPFMQGQDATAYCRSGDCEQGNEIASRLTKLGRPPTDAVRAIGDDVERAVRAGGWEAFKVRKDAERAEAAAAEPEEPEGEDAPHPLTNRGLLGGPDLVQCSRKGCTQQIDLRKNKSGLCRWCSRGLRVGSPSHGVPAPSEQRNRTQRIRRAAKGPGRANVPVETARIEFVPASAAKVHRKPRPQPARAFAEIKRLELILGEIDKLSPEGRDYLAATLGRRQP